MATPTPGPFQPIVISGNTTGILDPTQPGRLLSTPGSTLILATFHPRTASHSPRQLSRGDELCSNKRIVIEMLPSGDSFWRWVPRAKGVENAGDEGEWPRVVDICGQHVLCSQEQWEIYKLDPQYECTVHPAPLLSTIARRSTPDKPAVDDGPATRSTGSKRAYVEESDDEDLPMPGKLKKTGPVLEKAKVEIPKAGNSEDSDDEIEMLVDGTVDIAAARARQKKMDEKRRRKAAAKAEKSHHDEAEDLSMIDLTIEPDPPLYSGPSSSSQPPSYTSNPPSFSSQPPSYTYNGANFTPQAPFSGPEKTFDGTDPSTGVFNVRSKRRTSSPQSHIPSKRARREGTEFAQKKVARERQRTDLYEKRVQQGRDVRQKQFIQTLRATVPPCAFEFREQTNSTATQSPTPQPESASEEDPVSLEEKIRRIQELNAYEQARRERDEARRRAEAAEAEQRRKQEETLRREHERAEEQRFAREQERIRRQQKQQEEQEHRHRQFQEEQERRRRQQQEERFSYGPWTSLRALERYKSLAEAFDNAKYTPEDPVTFATIPWPVLHKPSHFTVEDVDWSSVETFFKSVRSHMRSQDYKIFIEKSHRRFHPDRWRARRVLQTVDDDELRSCLEVAANTVAQAITPLWREIKG